MAAPMTSSQEALRHPLSPTVSNRPSSVNPNSPRKPLPAITMPGGRMQTAPESPIKVKTPSREWAPEASSAQVETMGDYYQGGSQENGGSYNGYDLPSRPRDMQRREAGSPGGSPRNITQKPREERRRKPSRADMEYEREFAVKEPEQVPQLQYFHQEIEQQSNRGTPPADYRNSIGSNHNMNYADTGRSIYRHLTPNSQGRRSVIGRPDSVASGISDVGRGGSPAGHLPGSPNWTPRTPSSTGREGRPVSYVDLLNTSYPQPPPVPISVDNSQLRNVVGSNASLLSTQKTLEMYRQNVKKTNDNSLQYAFAVFLIQTAQEAGLDFDDEKPARKNSPKRDGGSPSVDTPDSSPQDLVREAKTILQKLADRSYPFAQYYLADGYASGLFNKGKEDYDRAFPLFVAASKHGHAESGYRAALCYEFGWGTSKNAPKAVQFYRQAASKNHPGAMTRLGRACLSGDLGVHQYREGIKWLKRATEQADQQYNAAPYHLALLYETGYGEDIFKDETYAAQLLTQAAELGNAEACYRLGDAYEHGTLTCPRDPALSVHFYTGAAEAGHPAAMMALCAWYMVGAEPVLEKDEAEAYEWAKRAAEFGLTKAEYAVGYFTEMGIGCRRDPLEANVWYVKSADSGDERAIQRLAAIRAAASGGSVDYPESRKRGKKGDGKDDKDCIVM